MGKANFINGLNVEEPIELKLFVSIDNEKQNGENLAAFVKLINSEKNKIARLVIIDTTYLHRHYNHEYSNVDGDSAWLIKNKPVLRKLEVECQVVSYKEITESTAYRNFHAKLSLDFSGDERGEGLDVNFRNVVKQLAGGYPHKGIRREVIQYLLDECAGVLSMEGYFTYCGELNRAIKYVREKYKDELRTQLFVPYRLRSPSPTKQFKSLSFSPFYQQNTHEGHSNFTFSSSSKEREYKPTPFAETVAFITDSFDLAPELYGIFFAEFGFFCQKIKSQNLLAEKNNNNGVSTHEPRPH